MSEGCDEICDGYCYSWGCNSSERTAKNKAIDTLKKHITSVTGVE